MKKIPILINYDFSNPIGTLEIDETKLPPYANYNFSIGYRAKEIAMDPKDDVVDELICASLQTDEQYMAYLNRERN